MKGLGLGPNLLSSKSQILPVLHIQMLDKLGWYI